MLPRFLLVSSLIIGLLGGASTQDILLNTVASNFSDSGKSYTSNDVNCTLESVLNNTISSNDTGIFVFTENSTFIGNDTTTEFDYPSIPIDYFNEINESATHNRLLRSRKITKAYNCQFKCIVSDLDGSLSEVGSNVISQENARALNDLSQSKIRFFISTGKSVSSSIKFMTNGPVSTSFSVFPGVYYNGALVYGPGGVKDILFETRIKSDAALELIKYLRRFGVQNGNSLRFESSINGVNKFHRISGEDAPDEVSSEFRLLNIAIENTSGIFLDSSEAEYVKKYLSGEVDSLIHKGVNLIRYLEMREGEKPKTLFKIVVAESPEVLSELREHVEAFVRMFGCKVHRSVPYLLEIIPENASKHNGTRLILKKLGLKFHQVAFLGDGENDIELMTKVGYPVATRGSTPAITYIARTVQLVSPEMALVNLINEGCTISDCNKKKD
ncbi:haloacid dehalogenase family-like protein [Cryptosporidium bovis]|uniref:haloacid dehalogenase family-like protein n=1 Tax=Cryptosporidium bovis TaxID=310047 RepID=UPI00351A12B5|nr:haloacid dehalogenase family-like protein [Cryptosporidium bovis]